MSRIEEAQRRLAEAAQEPQPATAPSVGVGMAESLAAEPFPVELSQHRTAPKAVPAKLQPAASTPAPLPPTPHSSHHSEPRHAPRVIELSSEGLSRKMVIDDAMLPVSREQYRRLAAALHHAQEDRGIKVVMISSAMPGEGKTLTAANLALTFSESYRRSVLLIDADLRRPSQHNVFKIDNSTGLSDGLEAVPERPMKVRQVTEKLSILPAGRSTSDPMAGLTSSRMQRLLSQVRDMFEWVIIDTPPVGLLPDANLLASFADGAVVVVGAGETPYPLVQKAITAVGKDKLLGVVLNRAARGASMSHYDYYYDTYYGQEEKQA
jgi:protein-tyrosine kinase